MVESTFKLNVPDGYIALQRHRRRQKTCFLHSKPGHKTRSTKGNAPLFKNSFPQQLKIKRKRQQGGSF